MAPSSQPASTPSRPLTTREKGAARVRASRADASRRAAEQALNTERRSSRRSSPVVRLDEQAINTTRRASKRSHSIVRAAENGVQQLRRGTQTAAQRAEANERRVRDRATARDALVVAARAEHDTPEAEIAYNVHACGHGPLVANSLRLTTLAPDSAEFNECVRLVKKDLRLFAQVPVAVSARIAASVHKELDQFTIRILVRRIRTSIHVCNYLLGSVSTFVVTGVVHAPPLVLHLIGERSRHACAVGVILTSSPSELHHPR